MIDDIEHTTDPENSALAGQLERRVMLRPDYIPKITITEYGMPRIDSSEIIKTRMAQKQIEALKEFRKNGVFVKAP